MFKILLLLFITVPLVELFVLLEVGRSLGALPTIGLCVFTAILGATLVRAQGLSTLSEMQASVQRGELPALALLEGVVLMLVGALLLTPGLVTDGLGFLCLIPSLRRALILNGLRSRLRAAAEKAGAGITIDGEFRHKVEIRPRLPDREKH